MSYYRRRNEINSQEAKKEPINVKIKDKNNSINLNIEKGNNKNTSITDKNNNIINNNNKNIVNKQKSILNENETKILLYPQNKPNSDFPLKNIKSYIYRDALYHSFNSEEKISFANYKVPLLY